MAAELEGASAALLLNCAPSSCTACLLDCSFFAAGCGCFSWLALGRGLGVFPAVVLLLGAVAACFKWTPAPCDVFAAACCSSLSAVLGCLISSRFCKGHHS